MITPKHQHMLAAIQGVSRDVNQALRMIYAASAYKAGETKTSGAAMFLESAAEGLEFAMRQEAGND
ncbi:hypothetical protein [Paracoccus saliphilus]|uniref:Uncharacterized protein n=1 Tax=Paracoccus saliphilus TaxID=405559 RepID=A0AA45W4Q4_9RHOB|nr:hypothetical protein [Paracoccus saliphilus]WCR04554.1 hypothetical protein JHX88_07500 [Paracoccus saliphilus]SIS86727.1 hypothetical protein SAMN05421772_10710 [Paracoccus saliphilus]